MTPLQQPYDDLSFYTLSLGDAAFTHQHIVDAQAAQTADKNTKRISLVFALVGLYLYIEKEFTGKAVQRFHMRMAQHKIDWPHISLPENRGNVTVADVMQAAPEHRIDKIHDWCASVWKAYEQSRQIITELVAAYERSY